MGNSKVKLLAIVLAVACLSFVGYKYCLSGSFGDITLNGNVEIQDVHVSSRCSGRVLNVLVDEGRKVSKGEVMAELENDILQAQLELSKAKLDEAEVALVVSKKDYERNVELLKKKSVSERIFDDSDVKYNAAKAQRNVAEANFKIASIQLSDATLRSPVDGIVLTKNVEIGETISAYMPAFSVMPLTKTRIKSFVNEEVLSKIKCGDKVFVRIDSVKDKEFPGHVSFISSEAEFTPKNIETKELRTSLVYMVRIVLDDDAHELKQGMPVVIRYVGADVSS